MAAGTSAKVITCIGIALSSILTIGAVEPRHQRFRSGVDAVRVDVIVTHNGRLVNGLAADDFEVKDQGVGQEVALIEVEQLPLDVICAFDNSASVAGSLLHQLTVAGKTLVRSLRQVDRIALLTFSSTVDLVVPLGGNLSAISAAFSNAHVKGRTRLRDGLFAALSLQENHTRRTLLLLFTDGIDTASWLTRESLIEAIKRTDVVVYPVVVRRPGRDESHLRFLSDVAHASAGRVIVVSADDVLGNTFTSTLGEFRARYVLTYVPTGVPPVGWHKVDVRLRNRRGTVLARQGYFVQ